MDRIERTVRIIHQTIETLDSYGIFDISFLSILGFILIFLWLVSNFEKWEIEIMINTMFIEHAIFNQGQPKDRKRRIESLERQLQLAIVKLAAMSQSGARKKEIRYIEGRIRGINWELNKLQERPGGFVGRR